MVTDWNFVKKTFGANVKNYKISLEHFAPALTVSDIIILNS